MESYSIKLQEKNQLSPNIYQFVFNRPNNFSFKAGQFIQFMIPDKNSYSPRSYSIVSTPENDFLKFCIKILDEGLASNFLPTLEQNDQLKMRGPFGNFTLSTQASSHIFIATSCGIAPIISIITHATKTVNDGIKLLFGLRSEQDIFYKDRLDKLSNKYSNFSYKITLSQPQENWNGLSGRVTNHLENLDKDSEFYLCGNRDMIRDVMNHISAKTEIHTEIF